MAANLWLLLVKIINKSNQWNTQQARGHTDAEFKLENFSAR
jgi:hypothetical protein